jgi:D-glycero-D-manno-heptose 1,7-bisphosphate phosphatase
MKYSGEAVPEKAVFIDRDGTLCVLVEYLSDPNRFKLEKGAGKAIRLLNENGFKVIVVTNQSAIARRYFNQKVLDAIHEKMKEDLAKEGARLDGVKVCPHHPDDGCDCRKPEPGLLFETAKEQEVDLGKSYLVGDRITDIGAGKAAGCTSIMVLTGYGEGELEHRDKWPLDPDHIADTLLGAVEWILKREKLG